MPVEHGATVPSGDVYDWYTRGLALLGQGHPGAAVQLLARVSRAEPGSSAAREALARAQFDTGRYDDALETFAEMARRNPADDYAQFGLGLAAARLGDVQGAVEHLALAVAMRPDIGYYRRELNVARATLIRRA